MTAALELGAGRGWDSSDENGGKSLCCYERSRKGILERREELQTKPFIPRDHLSACSQNADRNLSRKEHSDAALAGMKVL